MSVPAKYREMGDFWEYYAGRRTAPYLTVFTAGNHEAASHLWELFYGGWVAPNIYYLGAANVLRLGPLRIAGMSGIWKGFDYRKTHHERLPFSQDDVKSFYHVREFDVRKLLQLRSQVDIGLSHDWPRGVERWGNQSALWRMKPDFERESNDGTLGNVAAEYVMDRLRPPYWFAAHLHCKFAALKTYHNDHQGSGDANASMGTDADADADAAVEVTKHSETTTSSNLSVLQQDSANPDEIDLDEDDVDADPGQSTTNPPANSTEAASSNLVSEELRAQLPASFTKQAPKPKVTPGQPVPAAITNKQVRFLALDKCLPRRKFLQLLEVQPCQAASPELLNPVETPNHPGRFQLQYDPEWLAITRVFHPHLKIGDRESQSAPDLGEDAYASLIHTERAWVEEHVVAAGRLNVPANFELTAPLHAEDQDWRNLPDQPFEYTNPQTSAFCELLSLENPWDATEEERLARKAAGPPVSTDSRGRGGGYGRGFGGGGRGRGGRGRGRGRGSRGGRGGRGRFH